jgi:phosphatidylinositol alpha-1,6-mannosyltransferase
LKLTRSLLISAEYFPPQVGGISTMMREICSALGRERIACLTGVPSADSAGALADPVRVYRAPALFGDGDLRRALAFLRTWPRIALGWRPDIVQCATCLDAALVGYWLKTKFGLPLAIYAHGNEIMSAASDTWEKPRLALRVADRVLANSRYTAQLVAGLGVAPERIEVVNPGCDVSGFTPGAPSPALYAMWPQLRGAAPLLLTTGNLVQRKGQDVTLRALPELIARYPALHYAIVGDGRDRAELETLANSLSVRAHVSFLGRAPQERLLDLYRACDVFLMPSRMRADRNDVEGFGIVFLEANACGKPVVGGCTGGIPDAIIDGETGLLVDPLDSAAIGAAVRQLVDEPARARAMGETGRRRALEKFNWKTVAARIDAITTSLVRT